ncbi:MAG TPA: hypothetical protein PK002_08425 [Cellvibrio sp.]|nr:hypothetical protein [Cellvibrio sp.]
MKNIKFLLSGFFCSAHLASASLPDLAPPKVQLVDEFGVNVHSGQVQSSLDTVAIGGAMGLSHSISNYTNNFSMTGLRGYQDKFYTKGRVTEIDGRPATYKNAMRVHDIGGSADFELIVGGVPVNFTGGNVPNYTYRALGDKRHTLTLIGDRVVWTKPDGTQVSFEGGNSGYPDQVGLLRQIKYPNGFTIDVDNQNKRVTTNTGFALKYIHQYDAADATMDPAKYNIRYDNPVPSVDAQVWSNHNPKYVQAINTSVENCLSSDCVTNWPKAEFKWPAGMPRAIYLGDSTFKVTAATGAITEYYFRGFDLAYSDTGNVPDGYSAYQRYSPRLIGIKPAGSNEKVFQYTYKNVFIGQSGNLGGVESTWFILSGDAGQVATAKRYNQSSSYAIGESLYDDIQNLGSGYVQQVLPKLSQYPGAINQVTTREGRLSYEVSYRNFPVQYSKSFGPTESYGYDARGNMNSHTVGAITATASYPTSCDANNVKYCNSPIWKRDGKGNQTDYTYHAASGQVETVTLPANKNGVRAKTRYEYTALSATYFTASGSITGAPIWLKTAEKTCINTPTVGDACAGNASVTAAKDEVITRYEYNTSRNLVLKGMTVTAADTTGAIVTKRTCYQYDIYGNRIGETQPKANLSSCPQ